MSNGTIVGPITSGRIVAPVDSPGLLRVVDSITFSDSATLGIELGGLSQGVTCDFVDVGTNATLDGTLQLSFVGGFQSSVQPIDVFTNLTAGTSLVGTFANVASGARLNTSDGYGSFLVAYNDGQHLVLSDWLAARW